MQLGVKSRENICHAADPFGKFYEFHDVLELERPNDKNIRYKDIAIS